MNLKNIYYKPVEGHISEKRYIYEKCKFASSRTSSFSSFLYPINDKGNNGVDTFHWNTLYIDCQCIIKINKEKIA